MVMILSIGVVAGLFLLFWKSQLDVDYFESATHHLERRIERLEKKIQLMEGEE